MLTNPYTCRDSEELFAPIDDIRWRGFLIVVGSDNVVTGILTASDLSGELRNRVQRFTVLEEIERRLRRAVRSLSVDELRASFPEGDSRAKKINSSNELTLGNYSYVLDHVRRRPPRMLLLYRSLRAAPFATSLSHAGRCAEAELRLADSA